MSRLSIILITKNEEHDLADCLKSVNWADEIIICDSGSTDATLDIARQFSDKVYSTDWPGFGPQKNRALDKASGQWVLSIDADERVSPELKDEILGVLSSHNPADAYSIPRHSFYCGHPIRHGDWRDDRVTRLFQRNKAKFCDSLVHESLQVEGQIASLKAPLIHHAFKDLHEVLRKIDHYSTLGAQNRHQKGKTGSLSQALGHALWTFIRGYIFRLGFLDGKAGFQLAVSNAEGCYYRYLKLAWNSKFDTAP